jgi:hypothetical protein
MSNLSRLRDAINVRRPWNGFHLGGVAQPSYREACREAALSAIVSRRLAARGRS